MRRVLRKSGIALAVYAGLLALTLVGFNKVPQGFVPTQDKQYLVAFAQLPDAATLDRTEKVIRQMAEIGSKQPGVESAVQFPGLSINGFVNAPNAGIVFFTLKPFDERHGKDEYGLNIAGALNAQVRGHPGRLRRRLPAAAGERPRHRSADSSCSWRTAPAWARPRSTTPPRRCSAGPIRRPQLAGRLQRLPGQRAAARRRGRSGEGEAARGSSLTDLFQTMQAYLGSVYVNDFNKFGRTYQVKVQADAQFRATAENIAQLKVRNAQGAMIPLGSVITVKQSHGPDQAIRYNGYPSADINGGPAPGYSSGQAQAAIEGIMREVLPNGIGYEWTDLTYQQKLAGNTAVFIFPLCVLLVFLVLAAQYESWTLPLAVILIVPMSLLCAIGGVWLTKGDNNIFTQIGFLVLIGLACKNAILIVEFARELHLQGRSRGRRGAGGLPHPAASDPDDLVRLHHGRASAGVLQRRRRRDAARHGRRGVLRHAGRDLLRPGADAGVLRGAPGTGRAADPRGARQFAVQPAHDEDSRHA